MRFRYSVLYITGVRNRVDISLCLQTSWLVRQKIPRDDYAVCRTSVWRRRCLRWWCWRTAPVSVAPWKMEADWDNELERWLCSAQKTSSLYTRFVAGELDQKVHRRYVIYSTYLYRSLVVRHAKILIIRAISLRFCLIGIFSMPTADWDRIPPNGRERNLIIRL